MIIRVNWTITSHASAFHKFNYYKCENMLNKLVIPLICTICSNLPSECLYLCYRRYRDLVDKTETETETETETWELETPTLIALITLGKEY